MIDPKYTIPSLDHAAMAIMAQGLVIDAIKQERILDMEAARNKISAACDGDFEMIAFAMGVIQR